MQCFFAALYESTAQLLNYYTCVWVDIKTMWAKCVPTEEEINTLKCFHNAKACLQTLQFINILSNLSLSEKNKVLQSTV